MSIRRPTPILLGPVLGLAVASGGVAGQGSSWSGLRPVEPGLADVSPLARDGRLLPIDMRLDRDFDTLYAGTGEGGERWFARRHGGVTAVFPQSVYAPTGSGMVAVIPPDTTFVIGEPNPFLADRLGLSGGPVAAHDSSGGLRLDGRIDMSQREASVPEPEGERARTPRKGVGALLRLAGSRERRGR